MTIKSFKEHRQINELLPLAPLVPAAVGLAVRAAPAIARSAVANAISGHDMVIHAAAATQVYPTRDSIIHEVNVTGTRNVVAA